MEAGSSSVSKISKKATLQLHQPDHFIRRVAKRRIKCPVMLRVKCSLLVGFSLSITFREDLLEGY